MPTLIIIYTALGRTTELTGQKNTVIETGSRTEAGRDQADPPPSSLERENRQIMFEDHHLDVEQYLPDGFDIKFSMDLEQSACRASRTVSLDIDHPLYMTECSSRNEVVTSSTTAPIHRPSGYVGNAQTAAEYAMHDYDLERGTDAVELGFPPVCANATNLTWLADPPSALRSPGLRADPDPPLEAVTASYNDAIVARHHQETFGRNGDGTDEPPGAPAIVYTPPSPDSIHPDLPIAATPIAEGFETCTGPQVVELGHAHADLRGGMLPTSVRILPRPPGAESEQDAGEDIYTPPPLAHHLSLPPHRVQSIVPFSPEQVLSLCRDSPSSR